MSVQYKEIGRRLQAFRMGKGLSAEQVAERLGISRTAVYRFEKGEVVKIEALTALAQLLGVSLATLLGVEAEYISSAVTYFERVRQLEEQASQIVVLAGPISFLLSSNEFHASLESLLLESVPEGASGFTGAKSEVSRIMSILTKRKSNYIERRPNIVNLLSAIDIERLLRGGFVGRPFISVDDLEERRARARREVRHFIEMVESEPIGVQIGLVTGTLPATSFQIFRTGEKRQLVLSPFRLGEQPNIRLGVAIITSADDAVQLHEKIIDDMWAESLKGKAAADYLRKLINSVGQ